MIRVRLFKSGKRAGLIDVGENTHRMIPKGVLTESWVEEIRVHLGKGKLNGLVGVYQWYRQATGRCPADAAKACPCDTAVCPCEDG